MMSPVAAIQHLRAVLSGHYATAALRGAVPGRWVPIERAAIEALLSNDNRPLGALATVSMSGPSGAASGLPPVENATESVAAPPHIAETAGSGGSTHAEAQPISTTTNSSGAIVGARANDATVPLCLLQLDADVCVLPLGHVGYHRDADGVPFDEYPF